MPRLPTRLKTHVAWVNASSCPPQSGQWRNVCLGSRKGHANPGGKATRAGPLSSNGALRRAPEALLAVCQTATEWSRPSVRRHGGAGVRLVPRIARLALVGLAVAGLTETAFAAEIAPGNGGSITQPS